MAGGERCRLVEEEEFGSKIVDPPKRQSRRERLWQLRTPCGSSGFSLIVEQGEDVA